jgi:hypothetical protein
MSPWWKPERPEHRENPLLQACAQADMTAEQALDELAKAYANLEQTAARLSLSSPVRVTIPADGFTITGPVELPKDKP